MEYSRNLPPPYDSVRSGLRAARACLEGSGGISLQPDGAADARDELIQLQSDPDLANQAPLAGREADAAVRAAEQPEAGKDLGAYRVCISDRKEYIARARAETSFAESQRAAIPGRARALVTRCSNRC
jgi:hypothetical protein